MSILALDISLNTGYALGDGTPGGTIIGTAKFHHFKDDTAVLGRKFAEWLGATLDHYQPAALAIERTIIHGMKTNFQTTQILNGLAWEAHREAEFNDIARAEYQPSTIKKFITGNGRADKKAVIAAVRERGFKITDDHQADAVAILLLHLSKTKPTKE